MLYHQWRTWLSGFMIVILHTWRLKNFWKWFSHNDWLNLRYHPTNVAHQRHIKTKKKRPRLKASRIRINAMILVAPREHNWNWGFAAPLREPLPHWGSCRRARRRASYCHCLRRRPEAGRRSSRRCSGLRSSPGSSPLSFPPSPARSESPQNA